MVAKFETWLEKSACRTEMEKKGEQRTHPERLKW